MSSRSQPTGASLRCRSWLRCYHCL